MSGQDAHLLRAIWCTAIRISSTTHKHHIAVVNVHPDLTWTFAIKVSWVVGEFPIFLKNNYSDDYSEPLKSEWMFWQCFWAEKTFRFHRKYLSVLHMNKDVRKLKKTWGWVINNTIFIVEQTNLLRYSKNTNVYNSLSCKYINSSKCIKAANQVISRTPPTTIPSSLARADCLVGST